MAGSWGTMPSCGAYWRKVTSLLILGLLSHTTRGTPRTKEECAKEYEEIKKHGCVTEGGFTQQQALNAMKLAQKMDEKNMSLYLTGVVVNLTQVELLEKTLQPKDNDTFRITVYLGKSKNASHFAKFLYQPSLGFQVYRGLFIFPIKVNVNSTFRFTVHRNDDNWHPYNISLQHLLSTSYLEVTDFCSDTEDDECQTLVGKFYKDNPECGNIDEYDFVAKYHYCDNNTAPMIFNNSKTLHYDDLISTNHKQPLPIANNYIIDKDGNSTFEYHLLAAKHLNPEKLETNITVTTMENCLMPSPHAKAYFCIQKSTGKIFLDLQQGMDPTDDFNISIRVKDYDRYPPRSLDTYLTFTTSSMCRNEFTVYQRMIDADISCNKKSYNVTIVDTNVSNLGGTRPSIRLDTSGINSTNSWLYVAGIYVKNLSAWNSEEDLYLGIGNHYLKLERNTTNRQSAWAKFFSGQVGNYAPFIPPISYMPGDTLQITNEMMGNEMMILLQDSSEFKLEDWGIVLIESKESYCGQKECVNRYNEFIKAYYNENETMRIKCRNQDLHGFDAKYGYCEPLKFKGKLEVKIGRDSKGQESKDAKHIKMNSTVTISNCKFEVQLEARDVYWLKDGKQRIELPRPLRYVPRRYKERRIYEFVVPDYVIPRFSQYDQGTYQCVVVDRGIEHKSNETTLKMLGNAIYTVSLTLKNRNWTSSYSKKDSNKRKGLIKNLTDTITDACNKKFKSCGVEFKNVTKWKSKMGGSYLARATMAIYVTADNKERLRTCETIGDVFTKQMGSFVMDDIAVSNFDCCMKESQGDDNFKGKYSYGARLVTQLVTHECKWHNEKKHKKFTRTCMYTMTGAKWSNFSTSVDVCEPKDKSTGELINIGKVKVTPKNAETLAANVTQVAHTGKAMANPVNIHMVTDIIDNIIKVGANNTKVVGHVINCVSSIVNTDKSAIKQSGSSGKILNTLDVILKAQKPPKGHPMVFASPNLALGVTTPDVRKELNILIKPGHGPDGQINISFVQNTPLLLLLLSEGAEPPASMTLPKHVVKKTGHDTIKTVVFNNDNLFSEDKKQSLSMVMSATVGNQKIANEPEPISMEFALTGKQKLTEEQKEHTHCRFWVPELNDTDGIPGPHWSSAGCNTTLMDNGRVECKCDHLTSFSVILDVTGKTYNPPGLDYLSQVLCAVSIVSLILTIVNNLMFKEVRKKVPTKILVNLSFAIIFMLLFFQLGAEYKPVTTGCRVFAALIQYFQLASFSWMIIEGINLYRNFVKVFNGGSTGTFLRLCYAFGWGFPMLITGITAAVRWKDLGPETLQSPNHFCIVQGRTFYVAVVVPVAAIILANFILLVFVLRGIHSKSPVSVDTPRERSKKMRKLRTAFMCSTLLGSTWVFAFLGPLNQVFAWIFAVLNSLQGFFLFYFYTFTNKKIREGWRALIKANNQGKHKMLATNHSIMSKSGDGEKMVKDAVPMTASTATLTSITPTLNDYSLDTSKDTTRDSLNTTKSSEIPKFPQFKMKRVDSKRANGKST